MRITEFLTAQLLHYEQAVRFRFARSEHQTFPPARPQQARLHHPLYRFLSPSRVLNAKFLKRLTGPADRV
jgi:hypothetical protein